MKKRTKGVLAAALAAAGVFLLAGLDARLLVRAYTVESGRLTGPVRLAVLTDLHACAYGEGQRELLDAVAEQSPDLVLLCGDIVDDEPRMPEARALDTVEALAAVWLICHRQSRVLDGAGGRGEGPAGGTGRGCAGGGLCDGNGGGTDGAALRH